MGYVEEYYIVQGSAINIFEEFLKEFGKIVGTPT